MAGIIAICLSVEAPSILRHGIRWQAECRHCCYRPCGGIVRPRGTATEGRIMAITMYDLAGIEADRRFSPFCWRSKMALAHKGLAFETVAWRFTEKDKLPTPNAGRVPVIVDGDRVVHDSTTIADYLDEHYPERPSLFGGEIGRALTRFVRTGPRRCCSPD